MIFDRVFLNIDGLRGDSAAAISWYTRAGEFGQAEAEVLLIKLTRNFQIKPQFVDMRYRKKSSLSSKTVFRK